MRRLFIAAAVLASACATVRSPEAAIRQATQRYESYVTAMDSAAIAAMFTPEGELEVPGGEPVRGPEAIRKYLEGFAQFHVFSDRMTTDRVDVSGTVAHSEGSYEQRVRLPNGSTVNVHGRYMAEWIQSNGQWRIAKLSTAPEA